MRARTGQGVQAQVRTEIERWSVKMRTCIVRVVRWRDKKDESKKEERGRRGKGWKGGI